MHKKVTKRTHLTLQLMVHLKVHLSVQLRTPLRPHLKICLMVYFDIFIKMHKSAFEVETKRALEVTIELHF